MRKFNGLRPQDVVVLLKRATSEEHPAWRGKDSARALALSPSEVSESLARCRYCRLSAPDPVSYRVHAPALVEFLLHGLPYVCTRDRRRGAWRRAPARLP